MEQLLNSENIYLKLFFFDILPLKEFLNLCSVNKYYNKFLTNEYSERLFEIRSRSEFDERIISLKENISWKQFYINTKKIMNMTLEGYIGESVDYEVYKFMKTASNFDIKIFYIRISNIDKELYEELSYYLEKFSANRDFKLLEWIYKFNNFKFHNDLMITTAISYENLDVIEGLLKLNKIFYVTPQDFGYALSCSLKNNFKVVNFLISYNSPQVATLIDTTYVGLYLTYSEKVEISDWLQSKGLPRID